MNGKQQGLGYPKDVRLQKRSQFLNAQRNGKRYASKYLVLYCIPHSKETEPSRFGVTISKQVSKSAVDRNNIRRHIKETLRQIKPQLKNGYDIVIIAKRLAMVATWFDFKKEIHYLLKSAGLLER